MNQNGVITAELVAETVERAILECACTLRPDFLEALARAAGATRDARAAGVLEQMLENARIAADDRVPLCQDTGSVWVCLEVGEELSVPGRVFSLVDEAVARAYEQGRLRMSLLADALFDRANTRDNTPAFCELRFVPGSGAVLHVMLKGGGSDNASRVVMLAPGAGAEGVRQAVLDCVREKAANACPPLLVGVGVGATFDKVAGLAKHALLREVGAPARDAETTRFEEELLAEVNALGIGPAALGGAPTALAVHVETAPCHIAALPVAVNMGCCAMRSASVVLVEGSRASEANEGTDDSAGLGDSPRTDGAGPRPSGQDEAPCSDEIPHSASSSCLSGQGRALSLRGNLASGCIDGGQADDGELASGCGGGTSPCEPVSISLPLSPADAAKLRAGDEVRLSGPVFTMRDAGHERALAALRETGELPFGLAGQTLFYAGPTPSAAGRPLGSVGPTTASRMDFATPALMQAGIAACIGKGKRSPEVAAACQESGGIYFATVGGIAALLATHVAESEDVAWEDLGTEALRKLTLRDFPAYVAIDIEGNDLYRTVEKA